MSLLTDKKMYRYIRPSTGQEVVMMNSANNVGEFVRKDVYEQTPAVKGQQTTKVVTVTPTPTAKDSVKQTTGTAEKV